MNLLRVFSIVALLASIAFSAPALRAQGVSYTGTPIALTRGGFPAAGATVTVCIGNVTVTLTATPPCAPYASIFSDPLLAVPIVQPGFKTDGLGNYPFFVATSQTYTIVLTGSGFTGASVVWNSPLATGNGASVNFVNAGVFTNLAMNEYMTSLLGGINISTEFSSIQAGNFSTDALAGGIAMPVGAAVHNGNAIAGYANTSADSASRTKANTVAGYFQCRHLANNSACWPINGVIQDAVGLTGHSMSGHELDINLFGTPAFLKGFYLTGLNGGGTVPATATAFEISTPFKFPVGFICGRASCNVGLQLADALATNPSAAQPIQFISHDSGGTPHVSQISSDLNGILSFTPIGPITAGGVAPTFTGSTGACATITTFLGASWSGSFKCTGVTGASTIVIIPGPTAANGWSCSISDTTTAANVPHQSAYTTTNCTVSGTVNQNDVLTFSMNAF